ncbi:YadA-like family protein [Escherichia coli]|nr:YadA-like family protein [Escherichia coli]
MKRFNSLFLVVAFACSAANAAGTAYDDQQDTRIKNVFNTLQTNLNSDMDNVDRRVTADESYITDNRSDIRALEAKESSDIQSVEREIQTTNNYVNQVQGQSSAVDAAQQSSIDSNSQRISVLENAPKVVAVNGKDGKDGKAGATGKRGATGQSIRGATGATGKAGRDGKDGVTTLVTKTVTDTATKKQAAKNTKDIQENHKEAMRGVASAMAMTGLHYTNDNNSIAIGAGEYASSGAAAMGYRHKFSEHVAATVQASYDGENTGVAGSVAIGW